MRLGRQQTSQQTTERPRVWLNRVKDIDRKQPRSENRDISAEEKDPIIGMLDIKMKQKKIHPVC